MSPEPGRGGQALADVDSRAVRTALTGDGLWLDVGAVTIRVRSDSPSFAHQLQRVYGAFPFDAEGDWADIHADLHRARGLRRWLRPQVTLHTDGQEGFEPFPADTALPLFEWGCNWLIGRRMHRWLLLHAGVVERDGLALVLPALPGSGKSTLTAALAARGWRLLSDEFGSYDPQRRAFVPMLKPVALKNESIGVIRRYAPDAVLGPEFPNTRKGTVAHLAPNAYAVARRHDLAPAGAVVLPRWQAGAATQWTPLAEQTLFPALAFNAFNYSLLGADGFKAAVGLVRDCPGWQLVYSDLDDALATLDRAWPEVVQRHRERAA